MNIDTATAGHIARLGNLSNTQVGNLAYHAKIKTPLIPTSRMDSAYETKEGLC